MKKRIIISIILFSYLNILLYSDSYNLSLTSSEGEYFKESTVLTAKSKIKGGWYKLEVNGSKSGKWGVLTSLESKTNTRSVTVYESGIYHAYLYKEQFGWTFSNYAKHCSIQVYKDNTSPTIQPTASTTDWINGHVTVFSNASDSGSGISSVYYKIDHATKKYGTQVTVSQNCTITFYAYDKVGNDVTVETYKVENIDKTKPTFSLSADKTSYTNKNILIKTDDIKAPSGIKKTQFKDSNNKWVDVNSQTISSNGTVYCKVQNNAGTWSDVITKKVDYIDKTPPNLNFEISPTGWTSGKVSVTPSGTDNNSGVKSIKVEKSLGVYTPITSVKVSKNETLRFLVQDNAGNSNYITYKVSNIDTTSPLLSPSVTPSGWTSSSKLLKVNSSDAESGILSTYYSYDNIKWISGNSVTITDNKKVYLKTKNKAGKWSYNTYSITGIDKTIPEISLSVTPKNWSNNSKTIIAAVKDKESGIKETYYSFDNKLWKKGLSVTVNSNTPIYFKTKNGSSLWGTSSCIINKIDKTAPVINLKSSLSDDEWTNKSVTVIATCLDNESSIKNTKFSYDNISWSNGNKGTRYNNGPIYFLTENGAGSIKKENFNIKNIDLTIPTISFIKEPSNLTNKDVIVTATGIDPESGIYDIQYKDNTGTWISSNKKTFLNNGSVTFKTLNKAGSWSDPTTYIVNNIDKIKPVISNPFVDGQSHVKNILFLKEIESIVTDENLLSVEYSFNNHIWNQYVTKIDISDLKDNVNILYIKATDIAGNITIKEFEFIKDTKNPIIEDFILNFNNNEVDTKGNTNLLLHNLEIIDNNLEKYGYTITNINTGKKLTNTFLGIISSTKIISLVGLEEGKYSFNVNANDKSGNVTNKIVEFNIDRTPPDSESISLKIYNNWGKFKREYSEDDVSGFNDLNIDYTISDPLIDSPRYKYLVTKIQPSLIDNLINNIKLYNKDSTINFSEGNGLYYIYSYLIDDAGNISDNFTYRKIRYNNSIIPEPIISGVKEATHLTDVIEYNNPRFTLRPKLFNRNGNIIKYGDLIVESYEYKLFKGTYDNFDNPYKNGELLTSNNIHTYLDLYDLPDNESGEYYTLFVRAKSNTQIFSSYTNAYKFRIDTKPPEFLTVKSSSHIDPKISYSYDYVNFYWDSPWDKTGVETYRYSVSKDGINYIIGDDNNIIVNGDRHSLRINLEDEFEQGSLFLHVDAIDYAGNVNIENSNTLEVKINRAVPSVFITSINNNLNSLSSEIKWESSDNTEYVILVIDKKDNELLYVFPKSTRSFIFDGLENGQLYKVKIYAYSAAIDSIVGMDSMEFKVDDITNSLIEPTNEDFTIQYNGFRVDGEKNNNNSTGNLLIPSNLNFETLDGTINNIKLENLTFYDDKFISGSNKNVIFTTSINGLNINPTDKSGITFNLVSGLSLTNRLLEYPIDDDESININFDNIDILSASSLDLNANKKGIAEFSLQTINKSIDSWLINNITDVSLKDKNIKINDGQIDFSIYENLFIKNLDELEVLQINNSLIKSDRTFISGNINTDFFMSFGYGDDKMSILVTESQLIKDQLVITKAQVILDEDYSVYDSLDSNVDIIISDLRIDQEGNVTKQPFLLNPFNIKHNENCEFSINKIDFSKDGISVDGYVLFSDKKVIDSEFSNFSLTNRGIGDNSKGIMINNFNFISKSGFTLSSNNTNVKITSKGYLLESAIIDLSPYEQGLTATVLGTVVDFNYIDIIVPGTNSSNCNLKINKFLTINSLELNDKNLIALNTTIILPDFFESKNVVLDNMIMDIDKLNNRGYFQKAFVTNSIKKLTLKSGFIIDFNSGFYENNILTIPEYSILLPKNSSLSSLTLTNLEINKDHVTYDPLPDILKYNNNGWKFTLFDPYLNLEGITGETILEFSIDSCNQTVNLDSFTLLNNGEYLIPKTVNKSSIINLAGFKSLVEGLTILDTDERNSITFDSTKIIKWDKSIELELLELEINSNGEVLNSGQSMKPKEFISNNGFVVNSKDIKYKDSRLYLSGEIFLPELWGATSSINIDNCDIEITNSWDIITKEIVEPSTLKLNGIEVLIEDYIILKDGLFISTSSVVLENSQRIIIKNSLLNTTRGIISPGYIKDKNNIVTIDGWNMIVTEACFTDVGIELTSHLELSENLGSPTLFFDDLKLYKENNRIKFSSNTTISSLEFLVKDMEFKFDKIKLNTDSISINNGHVTLPEGEILGGETINIKYFEITKDGSFKLSGSSTEPININGFKIYIDDLSLKNNKLNILGSAEFPNDFGIKELNGKKVTITKLEYDFSNKNLIFDIELNNIIVEISEGWTTEISNLSISNSGFNIGNGIVKLPSDWLENISITECGFKDLSYDFNNGVFDIKEIFINNVFVECEGYEFIINKASYSGSDGFSFGGEFPLIGLFEGEETPPSIIVKNLQIQNDFTISDLDAGFEGDNLSLTPNRELLYSGYIGIVYSNNNFLVSMTGTLEVGDTFELEDLRGDEIDINSFTFNILDKEITNLNATLELSKKEFLDTEITNFKFGIDYENDSEEVKFTLGGDAILPQTFPGIGGEHFSLIGEFDSLGNIYDLSSIVTLDSDRSLVGEIILKKGSKININPNIVENNKTSKLVGMEFSLNESTLEFSHKFSLKKLQGSSIDINELIIDTNSGFSSCDLSLNIPETLELYDDIFLDNGKISLKATDVNDITTEISGDLKLPPTMGEIIISINKFNLSSKGDIEVDSEASDLTADLLEQVKFTNGHIKISSSSNPGDLDFDLDGNFELLSENIPQDIKETEFKGTLLYTTDQGIESFYVGMDSGENINYELIEGVTIALDGISITDQGFGSSVSLIIDDGFCDLKGTLKTQGSIFMNWDGEITQSDLLIKFLSLEFANMNLDITNMKVNEKGFNFDSAVLGLPESLGSQNVGIENGGITNNGNIYGDFVLDVLNIDLLGCVLSLESPDIENEEVTCKKAKFILPEVLGSASVEISDVTIGSNGINIKGGGFSLPDIDTGTLNFTNMGATLIVDGDNYEIGATGKVFIASIGEVEAKISLVNISQPQYPIGLEYAYFSFETETGGIPLASTGVLITGVRGGLAFGPPGDDIPEYIKNKFSDGMRIQLGISLKDISRTISGKTDFWLNVTNLDFALKGELEFLNGLFSADATALYTKSYGMELKAGLEASLIDKIVLDGMVRAHIFEVSGISKFCGEATVDMSVENLLWGFPETPINLGSLGIEVGDFKSDKRGFKGYISLKLIGTKGFYYGSNGDFKLGNVNNYTLLDKSPGLNRSNNLLTSTINKRYSTVSNRNNDSYSSPERIIFCLEFSEGDPILSAVSPNGIKYSEGSENIVVERLSDKILMAVINPGIGNWDVEVNNLTRDSDFTIKAISFEKNPEISLDNPKYNKESITDSYIVNGNFNVYTSDVEISLYISKERGVFNGKEVAHFNPTKNGTFSYELKTLDFDNGEYFIYAGIYDGINPELYDYAPGSIIVNNKLEQIPAINDLVISTNSHKTLNISFSKEKSSKIKGYFLNSVNLETNKAELINIGNMNKLTLSSLNKSNRYSLSVIPYDNIGLLGNESNIVYIDYTKPNNIINNFSVKSSDINLTIGNSLNHLVYINPINFKEIRDANDYVELEVIDVPEFISFSLKNSRIKLDKNNSFSMDLICSESYTSTIDLNKDIKNFTIPGNYFITVLIKNIGNNNIYKKLEIPLNITYDDPKIYNISPEKWNIEDGEIVEIKGSGFTKETTIYIDDKICEVLKQNSSTLKISIPGIDKKNKGNLYVSNPNSEVDIFYTELIKPSYSIEKIKHNTVIKSGGNGWLYSKIIPYNNFNDIVDFSLLDYPEGWNINISKNLDFSSLFEMKVNVPKETENGIYYIKVKSNDILTIYKVEIVDTSLDPTILNLSSYSGNWGDKITVYGYGFNTNSKAFYNGQQITNVDKIQDSLLLTIPNNVSNGIITISNDLKISNAAEFEIKGDDFNIYPSMDNYLLLPGDDIQQKIYIRGYADFVNLDVISDSIELTPLLNKTYVEPNGVVELSVKLSDNIKSGTYNILVNGYGLNSSKSEKISISVGDNINFSNKELKSGIVDNDYLENLEIINNLSDFTFQLTKDSCLPYGLYLNKRTGDIYGTPKESGSFNFTIKVIESNYRYREQEFSILIKDSGWFKNIGPLGNNRFNNITSPGENTIIWSSDKVNNIDYLLSSGANIYTVSPSKINILSKLTGMQLYVIPGDFIKVSLKDDKILTLENRYIYKYNKITNVTEKVFDDIYLVVYDSDNGFEISNYKGVNDYNCFNKNYINRSGSVSSIDFTNKTNIYNVDNSIFSSDVVTTADGIFKINDSTIEKLINDNFTKLSKSQNKIEYFTSYQDELIVLDNFGNYQELGSKKKINTDLTKGKIIVGPKYSLVYNNSKVNIIDRNKMDILSKSEEIDELILTKDKFIILNRYGVTSYNLYTGNKIWNSPGYYKNIISSGNNLYAINNKNKVICFGGRSNIYAPNTQIVLNPMSPDGSNGYYKTKPELNFKVNDVESYANTIFSIDDLNWLKFNNLKILNDGKYNIRYQSYDSYGFTEVEKSSSIKIDTISPVSKLKTTSNIPNVICELSASDDNSQIDTIMYEINGTQSIYTDPVIISKEGLNTFRYWSIDKAGNIEDKNSENIFIESVQDTTDNNLNSTTEYPIETKKTSNNIIFNKKSLEVDEKLIMKIIPEKPDGNNGYYKTQPIINFNKENSSYSLDGVFWNQYLGEFILNDGEFNLSNSFNKTESINLKIDSTKPVTTIIQTETEIGLKIELSSTDQISKVENIYYSINGKEYKYTTPILLNNEGLYSIYYWSKDFAGNEENKKLLSLSLDLYNPKVESGFDKEKRVILTGSDSFSGLNRIEFRINGSPINIYKNPIVFSKGYFNLTFRSVDNVERESEWKNICIDNIEDTKKDLIDNLLGGTLINNKDNFKKLSSYLLEGLIIEKNIDASNISFKTAMVTDLYLISTNKNKINKSWNLVESQINGYEIYHKILEKDELVKMDESEDLIVVIKNPKEDLVIYSPVNGNENWYAATELTNELSRSWFYKIEEDNWIEIGESYSGELELPELEAGSKFELKVEVEIINTVSKDKIDHISKIRKYTR